MKPNRATRVALKALIFSSIFAIIFKWWTIGNPFQLSTLFFGVTILIILLLSLGIADIYFRKLNMPVSQLKKRIIPMFITFLTIILLASLITISASYYITNVIAGVDRSFIIKTLFETELPSALKYYSFFALMASVFFFFKIWQEAIDREQQLREENLKYKYRTLKTQVNPHFLFNSLNTLSELIYIDAKRADNYTQKLAKIYRYILENEETDLIPLNEELDFVKQYFDLQKERNGDKIQLDIRIENANSFKIIPISLQILVENALKHNSASKEKPLTIYIYDDDGYIVVSNTIQRKSTLNTSSGTGLDNLQQRTKLITGKDVILTQHNLFIVKLPIIKQSQ